MPDCQPLFHKNQDTAYSKMKYNQLTISGEKKQEREEKEGTYHLKEISHGKFSRSITLPFEIDPNDAKTSFSNGLLEVSIKKPAEMISKPHTITIKSNGR